jgi:hypothetical protein
MKEPEGFDRLTPDARKVLELAQEEARRFDHHYIGTEHLLLGLMRLEESASATVLKNLGVELNKVRGAVEFIIGRGDRVMLGEIGLTPRAKQVIALAFDEARLMQQQEAIGPEHLLLGLVREGEGIAAGVLESLGINLWRVRQETYRVLGLPLPEGEQAGPPRAGARRFADVIAPLGLQWHEQAEPARGGSWSRGDEAAFARFSASFPLIPAPPMVPQPAPPHRYRPWHIDRERPEKTVVGSGTHLRPVFGPTFGASGAVIPGTLLGWVVVNTGGQFTLTLYDGLAPDAPALAVIHHPPTGAHFPFHFVVKQGLTYTLEGTPGSVTIIYDEMP